MTHYSTGELAKLCGVTVRTVQFYDSKGLLCPSDLTEGGRRIYSEDDAEKLRVICFLKELGFSLKDIAALVNEPDTDTTLRFLVENQQRDLERKVAESQAALDKMNELRRSISHFNSVTPKAFGVIADIMDTKKKLRDMRIKMVVVGLLMDAAWIAPLVYGIVSGTWWPFAIGVAIAIVLGVLISRYYISHTAYLCPECHAIFRPPLNQNLFAAHTPSMRKLTCPICGYRGYCLEVYVPASKPTPMGKYLVWNEGDHACCSDAAGETSPSE